MHMPRNVLIALALAVGPGAAEAASDGSIGSAVTVVNYVTASLDNDARRLSTGDDVRQQELIEVNENSRSEIELNDRTKLALGPGSRLLLDRFVYDPEISGGAIVLNLVKGTFRFITGIAAKPAYVIRTPAASITVRGTIFDVYVMSRTETWLLLIEGAVEVCTESGKCLVHDEPGKLIRITADNVEKPVRWAKLTRRKDVVFDDAFPFIAAAPSIDPDPIFTRDDIVLGGGKSKDRPGPKRTDKDDDAGPSKERPKKIKVREYRERRRYAREIDYRHKRHHYERGSRAGRIIKKGIKVGIGVGIGVGIAKALGRGRRY